jgi:hypothetical protein
MFFLRVVTTATAITVLLLCFIKPAAAYTPCPSYAATRNSTLKYPAYLHPAGAANVEIKNNNKTWHTNSVRGEEQTSGTLYPDGSASITITTFIKPRNYYIRLVAVPLESAIQHVYKVYGPGSCELNATSIGNYWEIVSVNVMAED